MAIEFSKDLESVENYQLAKADSFVGWECHHKLETHFSDGTPRPADARLYRDELKALDMYYNRPAEELIFMRHSEHTRLHHLGRKCSVKHKMKVSNSLKGHTVSNETRMRISNTLKGNVVSGETREKISEHNKAPIVAKLYKEYKANGGSMCWNEFQMYNKNKDI